MNDYRSKLSEDSIKRLSENPLRILDSKNAVDQKILIDAPNVLDYLNEQFRERCEHVCEGLNALKMKYEIDKNIWRGLAYYCKTDFAFMQDK